MKQIVLKPASGKLVVRAYCTKCNKLLMESNPLTKKQLLSLWDKTVIDATKIPCEDCKHKFPNFDIELKIFNKINGVEYSPYHYIKLPKGHRDTPEELFKAISRKWLKEHPDAREPTAEEVADAINESNSSITDKFKRTLELRKQSFK